MTAISGISTVGIGVLLGSLSGETDGKEVEVWRVTDRFNAIGTSGEEYVILELADLPESSAAEGFQPQAGGPRKHTLEDGRELSTEKDGTFILVETDEVLKAVSPSAPAGA